MNQFQVFIGEKLTHTDKKNEAMNRLSIHVLYDSWFYFDNDLVKIIHLTEEEIEIEAELCNEKITLLLNN